MRQFAVDHDEVWLARWRDGHLVLEQIRLFDADGRLPAFKDGVRCADDVCDVTTFPP